MALPQYVSRGATAWANEKSSMFRHMADDVWDSVELVHNNHRQTKWDGDEDLSAVRDVYLPHLTTLAMETLDHSLVCVQLLSMWKSLMVYNSLYDR